MSNSYSPINLTNPTNFLQWNVRSLKARLLSLQCVLSCHKCSIALLSETWLLPSRSVNIPNYVSYRSDRHDGYGGAAIIIHNSLMSRPVSIAESTHNNFLKFKIDIVGAEVSLPNSSSPLAIWSCYIPNDSNIPVEVWDSLFSLVRYNSLLGGDFNAFHPAWGSHSSSRRDNLIYDTISPLGLCILNNGNPTHIGRSGSPDSAIDLSFCSPDLLWSLSWSVLDDSHGSDHFPILISATTGNDFRGSQLPNPLHNPIDKSRCTFNFNKANWTAYSSFIQHSIASTPTDLLLVDSYSTLTKIIDIAAKQFIALKNTNPTPSLPLLPGGTLPVVR